MEAYFFVPSVLVSLLVWWPLRCFSQAMAPLPAITAAASKAIVSSRFKGVLSIGQTVGSSTLPVFRQLVSTHTVAGFQKVSWPHQQMFQDRGLALCTLRAG